MSDDLEAILTGADADTETAVEQPRDDSGKFASSEAPDETADTTGEETAEQAADASPASEETKVDTDSVKAGLEAELARIRAKNRELEERLNQPALPPEEKPDFFEDPDRALNTLESRIDQKITRARIDWSENAARARHEDFDEKIGVFSELAQENPMLWEQMARDNDPAEFAYKQAVQVSKMREFGSIQDFEAKIRAEERAKATADAKAEYEAKLKELTGLPGSLSDARAAGGNNSPPVTDDSLEDIFGR